MSVPPLEKDKTTVGQAFLPAAFGRAETVLDSTGTCTRPGIKPSVPLLVTSKSPASPCQLTPPRSKPFLTQRRRDARGTCNCRSGSAAPRRAGLPAGEHLRRPAVKLGTGCTFIVGVIPAQAGIQGPGEPSLFLLDSRLRGNDARGRGNDAREREGQPKSHLPSSSCHGNHPPVPLDTACGGGI